MTRITAEIISAMRSWEHGAAAAAYDHRARMIESESLSSFSELGIIVKEVDDQELWRWITKTDGELCHSWDDWVQDALPVSRATAYSARKVAQRLSGIPEAERALISPGNLRTLAEVDDAKITGSRLILDAARNLKPEAFRAKIMREFPERHLEAKQPYRFHPTEGQREDIDSALALAVAQEGCLTREEALWSLANFYIVNRPLLGSAEEEEAEAERVVQ